MARSPEFETLLYAVEDGIATVSVVGHGICSAPGVARKYCVRSPNWE